MLPGDLPRLPRRRKDSHKGVFGTVAVVGGSIADPTRGGGSGSVMVGAPALSSLAALRAGCGLCRLAMPAPLLPHGLAICPSATGLSIGTDEHGQIDPSAACDAIDRLAADASCLAVGPGLGTSPGAQAAVLRAVQQEDAPLVLDADGINAMGLIADFTRDLRAAAVLTPHPGEFRRLTLAMGLKDALGLDKSREAAATEMARRLGAVVVLKGAGTVVSDGRRVWANTVDHPCLATAGSGDVLTGIIVSVIAQWVPSPAQMILKSRAPATLPPADRPLDLFDAARIGVAVHGLCGVLWSRSRAAEGGLLAAELTEFIPSVIESLRG